MIRFIDSKAADSWPVSCSPVTSAMAGQDDRRTCHATDRQTNNHGIKSVGQIVTVRHSFSVFLQHNFSASLTLSVCLPVCLSVCLSPFEGNGIHEAFTLKARLSFLNKVNVNLETQQVLCQSGSADVALQIEDSA